jgi:F-type H+-transporting ATPase subunit delta
MVSQKVSNRYALSLLSIALEKNLLDTVYKDAKLLIDAFDESNELQRVIESPVIRPEMKISILGEIFSQKIDKETLNFIYFIVGKRREEILYSVAKRFISLRNEHLEIVELFVSTAFELNDDQKEMLKDRFEKILNKKTIMNFKVDDNLIGGFVAQVGDTVYDASLKHQLELLKKEFIQGGLSLN